MWRWTRQGRIRPVLRKADFSFPSPRPHGHGFTNSIVLIAGLGPALFSVYLDLRVISSCHLHDFHKLLNRRNLARRGDLAAAIRQQLDRMRRKGASVTGLRTAVGAAAYGLGSLTVESVRLVHTFAL
jgi:hypothetical protein